MNVDDLWFPGFCVKPAGSARLLSWRDGAGLVIAVAGELDVANATIVREQLRETMATDGVRDVAIDLAGIEFCDVAGLRVLVDAQQSAASRGITCRFVQPSVATLWLLHFIGLPAEPFDEPWDAAATARKGGAPAGRVGLEQPSVSEE